MTKQELASSVEEVIFCVFLTVSASLYDVWRATAKVLIMDVCVEFAGDLDALASYALSISIPQAKCIEEHLSDVSFRNVSLSAH